jgi:hypothetical protein
MVYRTVLLQRTQSRLYAFTGRPSEPEPWPDSEAALFDADWFQRADAIHVLGTRQNAAMISRLLAFKAAHPQMLAQVRIGGANLDPTRSPPALALRRFLDVPYGHHTHVGGWHVATAADRAVYELLATDLSAASPQLVTQLLRQHPAWPALGFLAGLSQRHAAALLSLIIDPRFRCVARPPWQCRLNQFLGLTGSRGRRRAERWLLDRDNGRADRTWLVLQTWGRDDWEWSQELEIPPERFLARAARDMRYESDPPSPPLALQRTAKIFLQFLKAVWLDNLAGRSCGDGLFDPSQFFARPDEVAAWKEHRRRLSHIQDVVV